MTEIVSLASKMHKDLYIGLVERERDFRQEINKVLFPMNAFVDFQQSANEFEML